MKCTRYFLATLASCLLASSAMAAVIVNDTWLDGTDSDPSQPVYSEGGHRLSMLDGDIESSGTAATKVPLIPSALVDLCVPIYLATPHPAQLLRFVDDVFHCRGDASRPRECR